MADRYLEDNSLEQDYYEEGIINEKNLITAGAIALGAFAGYKSGLFKNAISHALKEAAEHKPGFSIYTNNLKTWINSEGLEFTEKSIFRNKIVQTAKDLATLDKSKINRIYEDTKKDLKDYVNRVNVSTQLAAKKTKDEIIHNSSSNTQILRELNQNLRAVNFYSESLKDSKKTLSSKLKEETIKRHIDSKEAIAKSIKRTGLRKAEINDLFDFYIDSNGKVRLIEKTNYSFSKSSSGQKSAKDKLEDLLNSKVIGEDGATLNLNGKDVNMHEYIKDWKHMHVDKNLHINENGQFVDLRNRVRQNSAFLRNLATDWKVPVINVNPLRMVGFDKIGREKYYAATISENTLAPALTGVYGRSKENTIKNLKNKVEHLKGINEGVTIIDGDVYRLNKNGSITKLKYKSKKDITFIPKDRDAGTSYLNISENAQRKMFGLDRSEFVEYSKEDLAKMGKFKQFTKKVADFLDIGRQERGHIKDSVEDISNFDSYVESVIGKISKKVNPYKERKEIKHLSALSDFNDTAKDSFFITNRSTTIKDLLKATKEDYKSGGLNNISKKHFKRFYEQLTGSFSEDYEDVTGVTAVPYFITERLNQTLGSIGLGLSVKNTKSTGNTFGNLITKRFLPIYGAYQAWNFINIVGEDDTDNGKKPGNLDQHIKAGIAKIDIGMHTVGDVFGLPKMFKKLSDLTPGSDMLGELPGINLFTPSQTAEERADYWKNGYTPVRKGRYWSLNTTPFIGGKISYWKPNMLRESLADAKYSDSLYGSRKEYFLNYLNPHHYDRKNYYTRPYLMTSPAFENVPVFGPLLSGTIGKLVSPQQKMHKEYWNANGTVKTPMQLNEEQRMLANTKIITNSYSDEQEKMILSKYKDMNTLRSVYKLNQSKNIENMRYNDYFMYAYNNSPVNQAEYNKKLYQFMTSSGSSKTIGIGGEYGSFAKNKINKNGYSLGGIMGADERINLNQYIINDEIAKQAKYDNPTNPNNLVNTFSNQFENSMDVAGIYGFAMTGFITGSPGAGTAQIETSGYSRSFNKTFQDQDLGGITGDLSEIFRRLVQSRRNDVEYYNPIRNRMPNWLPGENGFINFQVGDPYSKIQKGELRLPGEGYERLHNISMPTLLKMKVGSSTIGKSKEDIVKHFLHQDEIMDEEALRITKIGTKMHEEMEKKLIASGLAIDTEREIKDEEHGVIGYYDAKIYDPSSLSRQAIVDIKTVSNKKFQQVKETGKPFDEHQRQVNFYLHNTDKNNKGYILYMNRDNPEEETITVGFKYDKDMYKSTMATLNSARQQVFDMLNQGVITRGDLYDPIDRFRILADVAPYSDEYAILNKQMSNMDLSKEEEEEVKAIRERVTAQRQQDNFYKYRFKNNDTISKEVKIDRQIDKQTFMVEDSDTPIKLAGIKINKGNEHYEEAQKLIDEYLAPGKKVKVLMAEDSSQRNNNDMLSSIKATVISDGVNVNKELIKRGLVDEDTDDFSAAGVKARFSSLQETFGSVWENIAHFDSPINTKLLQVRTAVEDYERTQVFDKEFKDWKHPIQDFLKPSIYTNANRNIIYGTLMGGFIGHAFGNTKFGSLVGGTVGVGSILTTKLYKQVYKANTGEDWVPKPVRRKREIEDYMDKLTFVKNRRLYEVYAKKALEEDGFDVGNFLAKNNKMGKIRKAKANKIQKVKEDYKKTQDFDTDKFENVGVKFDWKDKYLPGFIRSVFTHDNETRLETLKDKVSKLFSKRKKGQRHESTEQKWEGVKEAFKDYAETSNKKKTKALEKTVNTKINEYKDYKRAFNIPKNAMKAIEYYNKSEATMYGYDPGEPLTNIISALPKADRKYFREFISAPKKERKKILEITPKYMRRALQSAYGMQVDNKESLESYFKEHYLPSEDWAGWNENVDLNAMKVKLVQTQGERLQDYNLWKDDKIKADLYGKIEVPNIDYKTKSASVVKSKLEDLLGTAGYKNIQIDIRYGGYKPTVNLDTYRSNEDRYKKKIQERLNEI